MGHDPEINKLETYFNIPHSMITGLVDDLKTTTREDINTIEIKLYKLNGLKNKLRNCLTPTFGGDIE
jgi:hypothetical protein